MIETRIDAKGFLSQLADEVVQDYTAEDLTITELVTELLAFQVNLNPITVGTIEPTVTRSIQIQEDYLLNVLKTLRDTVGGYISVDNDRKLNWLNDIGEDKGQQIRYNKNIVGIHRSMDFDNFGNRLYCYGAGEGTARIKLSDVQTEDYVEDVPSQGTYGVCIRKLTERSITHPDTLLAWANLKLEEMKTPHCTYTVDMVYLSAIGWDFETLQLGSYVKVIDEDLGIDINARIVRFVRDLSNPKNVKVEISNPGKDIVDTLNETYDDQQLQKSLATKIGAGQVVVLGEFTVVDWLTAGTTNIKGDYIRSGVIQSNNWDAAHGSYYDLVTGTFKLGGSAAPKLAWDGSTLTVSGAIYATSGEFTGTLKVTNLESGKSLTIYGTIVAGGGAVKISSTGINIFGLANGLTTRATETGAIQCYVGADGKLYAGAGTVVLSSLGLRINGQTLSLYDDSNNLAGYIYGAPQGMVIQTNSKALSIGYAAVAGDYGNIITIMFDEIDLISCKYMDLPRQSSAPTGAEGRMYYDTTYHTPMCYCGSPLYWRPMVAA